MPSPTNPPCSGSWPEPPPEISATLPCTRGVGAHDDLRVGVVAQDVAVRGRQAGERLLDDLLRVVEELPHGAGGGGHADPLYLAAAAGAGVGVGDGVRDRRLDDPRGREEVVDERRERGADEAGHDVDGHELVPVRDAAAERGDELRARTHAPGSATRR